MRAEAVIAVAPFAASRHRHLHVLRKSGPDPEPPAATPGAGEEAPGRAAPARAAALTKLATDGLRRRPSGRG